MRITLPLLRVTVFGSLLSLLPVSSAAEVMELTHAQMRQLVAERQVLGTEQLVGSASDAYDGQVIDVRGFLSDGRMTYRMLLQRSDGSVIEVLMNGQSGQFVSHGTRMGQVVASAARQHSVAWTSSGQDSRNQASGSDNRSSSTGQSSNTGKDDDDDNAGSGGSNSSNNSGGGSGDANSGSSSASNASDNRNDNANSASRNNNRDNASNNRGNKENRGNGNGRDD